MTDILTQARQLIDGDRQTTYGDPAVMWRKVAKVWSVILGTDVTSEQALLAMCALKLVRESVKQGTDNLVDLAAYAEIKHRLGRATDAD